MSKDINVGDVVWVNEATAGGKALPHERYGKVVDISTATATVRDTTPGSSYYGAEFNRSLSSLEKKA